jgi:hypothetical protein
MQHESLAQDLEPIARGRDGGFCQSPVSVCAFRKQVRLAIRHPVTEAQARTVSRGPERRSPPVAFAPEHLRRDNVPTRKTLLTTDNRSYERGQRQMPA